MRYPVRFGCFFILLGFAGPAWGQSLADSAVCASLTRDARKGLYIAYPNFSPGATKVKGQAGCGADPELCISRVNGSNIYDPSARFYYVPEQTRGEEGVWHIRTQTQALNVDGADLALVKRPSVRTQCSPNVPLEIFQDGRPLVDVDDYGDYHNGRRGGFEFGRYFHFQIQEPPGGPGCIGTNSRAMGDLNAIYGFEGVVRRDRQVARLSFMPEAIAGNRRSTTRYAGLSSEFAYRNPQEAACFAFEGPRLTRSDLVHSDIDWRPQTTTIWIKRLRGKQVIETADAMRRVVTWRQ